jgi:hypothetical protein
MLIDQTMPAYDVLKIRLADGQRCHALDAASDRAQRRRLKEGPARAAG